MRRIIVLGAALAVALPLSVAVPDTAQPKAVAAKSPTFDCIKEGHGDHYRDWITDFIFPISVPLPVNRDIDYEADVISDYCWTYGLPRKIFINVEDIVGSYAVRPNDPNGHRPNLRCKVFQRLMFKFQFKEKHHKYHRNLYVPCEEGDNASSSFASVPRIPRLNPWKTVTGKLKYPRVYVRVKVVNKDPINDRYFDEPLFFHIHHLLGKRGDRP